jgi:hypothetical protein
MSETQYNVELVNADNDTLTVSNRDETLPLWSKQLFVLSLLLLAFVFTLQGVGIIDVSRKPKNSLLPTTKTISVGGLRCEEPVWNMGAVDSVENPTLSHEFALTNVSNEPVTIIKIHSTCGCIVADGYDSELPPGGSTKIRVEMQLPTVPQRFHKSLAVAIGEKHTKVLPLDVVGETMPNCSLHSAPSAINFGTINVSETKERVIQVVRYDFSPIDLDSVSVSENDIPCRFDIEKQLDGNKLVIKVRLTGTSDASQTAQVNDGKIIQVGLNVKTKSKNYPDLTIPVFVSFPGSSVD